MIYAHLLKSGDASKTTPALLFLGKPCIIHIEPALQLELPYSRGIKMFCQHFIYFPFGTGMDETET